MAKKDKTKKKSHKGLWITLIIIGVVIVLPISLLYILCFDTSKKNYQDTGDTTETILTNEITDLLDYSNNSDITKGPVHSMGLTLEENDFNQILFNLTKDVDSTFKQFVPEVYLDIVEGDSNETSFYDFHVSINCYGVFQTNICLRTNMVANTAEKSLIFEIKDIKVGRLPGLLAFGKSILNNFVKSEDVQAKIASAGLHMTVDLENNKIIYKYADLIADLKAKANLPTQTELFVSLLSEFMNDGTIEFSFYANKTLSLLADLTKFKNNPSYTSDDYVIDLNIDQVRDKYLLPMIKDNFVDKDTISKMTKFLAVGYNMLSSSEKSYIESLSEGLKNYDINDIYTYTLERDTLFGDYGDDISDIIKAQIGNDIISHASEYLEDGEAHISAELNEVQIHDILKRSAAVGFTCNFARGYGTEAAKSSYVVIDNFYLNIIQNKIYIVVGINLNGYETSMILLADATCEDGTKIVLPLRSNSLYYGTYKCSDTIFDSFIKLIGDSFQTSGTDWFTFDKDNLRFVIDLAKPLEESVELKNLITLGGFNSNITVSAIGSDVSEIGKINVQIDLTK